MRQSFYSIALLLLLLISSTNAVSEFSEEQLKAAFIFNFSRFTSWPESSLIGNFVFCVINENSPGSELKTLESRSVHNRSIEVRYYHALVNVDDCAVVYLPSANTHLQQQLIGQVRHMPVLTISTGAAFVEMGGMIGFEDRRAAWKFRQPTPAVRVTSSQ